MQLYDGLTIDQVIESQDQLFRLIPVEVDPDGRENDCYPNCLKKVERDGGQVVVGWRRTRVTLDTGQVASLDHHAVWQDPAGSLVDISSRIHWMPDLTPQIIVDSQSAFMPDPNASFGQDLRARPSRHIPLMPDPHGLLKEACERMDRKTALLEAGELDKARYEHERIVRLLRRHLGRR